MNPEEEYPYVVSLLQRNSKRQAWHTCGGVMITPNVILTAAHCHSAVHIAHIGAPKADHHKRRSTRALREKDDRNRNKDEGAFEGDDHIEIENEQIRTSSHKKRSLAGHSSTVKINRLKNSNSFGKAYIIRNWDKIQHPNFNPETGENDIMLVKIPVWDKGVSFIRMNFDPSIPNGNTNDPVVVLGWGVSETDDGDSLSETLQRAPLFSVSNKKCEDIYKRIYQPPIIRESMICAHSYRGRDACKGDCKCIHCRISV